MTKSRYDELTGEWYELSNVLQYEDREKMRRILFDLSSGGNQRKTSAQVAQITEDEEKELDRLEEKGVENILDKGGNI